MNCSLAKETKIYKIYIHKNKTNGKIYVGQTGVKWLSSRWRKGEAYYKNPEFYSDILKYGWDNFEHIILEKCGSKEEAHNREIYYIDFYKSNNSEFGYNLTTGGQKNTKLNDVVKERQSQSKLGEKNPMKKHTFTNQHRKRLSNSLKGKKKSREWIDKIMKNNNHKTMLGKKHTDEAKKKMSLSQMGNKKGCKMTYVLYLNDNHIEIYNSRKEIYNKINMTKDYISRNRLKRSFPTNNGNVLIMSKEEYELYCNGKCNEMFSCKKGEK